MEFETRFFGQNLLCRYSVNLLRWSLKRLHIGSIAVSISPCKFAPMEFETVFRCKSGNLQNRVNLLRWSLKRA